MRSDPQRLKEFEAHLPKESRVDEKAIYDYEVWLDNEIKRLKARIALIEEKGRIAGQETKPPRITFGGKAFYRSKDTTDIDMAEWHRARDTKREHMILFSGRFDAKEKSGFHPTRKRVGFSPLIYNT